MSPLAHAERQAYRAMTADPNDDTHRAWLDARRRVEEQVRSTGAVVEHHDRGTYTVYSLGYFNTLHTRNITLGRF
jgi:hypothetical protein